VGGSVTERYLSFPDAKFEANEGGSSRMHASFGSILARSATPGKARIR
jgi:hypothetical protein